MMFFGPGPRLFGLPPGVDFPARLADGIIARLGPGAPERLARVTVYLNTQRMRRRLRECFLARGTTFLPRMKLVTELAADPFLAGRERPVSRLGRRLELAVLVDKLLQAEPDLAPRTALYDLADSLAALMDELRAENVAPGVLANLEVEGHAAHWARTRQFVALVEQFFGPEAPADSETHLRRATEAQMARWAAAPPVDPVIIAGSTGSRGTTALLMTAAANLPQGALVVPGYDFDLPEAIWASLDMGSGQEDHPQYRYRKLMERLGLQPGDVRPWHEAPPADHLRNRLISLALRPAPVTDQWIDEGPALGELSAVAERVTLIEAPDQRTEAWAIALRLRRAVEEGQKAVLVSPDRDLTRRVAAALDRWGIRPDDSAGQPLLHAPAGRFLRLVARGMGKRLTVDECLTLLKHPLSFTGGERGPHLRLSRELELTLRRRGPAYPDAEFLKHWASVQKDPLAPLWAERLGAFLTELEAARPAPLADLVRQHRRLAEMLARGTGDATDGGTGWLWERESGAEALAAISELEAEAPGGFTLALRDYTTILDGVISARQVRETVTLDQRIEILGAQEARVLGADLVILAGLNEGVWPAQPGVDPWLNRRMRMQAGLLLPERRIGLSAHDFQMAVAAPEVVITRALRDAEAETVPSRWLNRLVNLLGGLQGTAGDVALAEMRRKGHELLAEVTAVEAPLPSPRAARPSPRPPLRARPDRLSLTDVERLIRDPYAIYARDMLKLRPLPPLRPLADARLRGEVLHRVPERFLRQGLPEEGAVERLMQITDEVLAEAVAWPSMRAIWRARMAEIAEPFVANLRAAGGTPVALERKYEVEIPGLGFRLVGKPDRLDLMEDGTLRIVDYKTGTPPSEEQQKAFAKQLHLAAVMAALGAFPEVGLQSSAHVVYVALRKGLKEVASHLSEEDVGKVLEEFRRLILSYRDPERGYTARRAMMEMRDSSDYDGLARFGEWDVTDAPRPEVVGDGLSLAAGMRDGVPDEAPDDLPQEDA